MSETTILDLDALLDGTMDSVADVPDYVTPPAGTYVVKVDKAELEKYKNKAGEEKLRFRILYSIVSTIELADDKTPPVANGSLFTETFMADGDGLAFFKRQAKKLLDVESLDGVTIRDILAELVGREVRVAITIRVSESNGTKYENINLRVLPPEAAA